MGERLEAERDQAIASTHELEAKIAAMIKERTETAQAHELQTHENAAQIAVAVENNDRLRIQLLESVNLQKEMEKLLNQKDVDAHSHIQSIKRQHQAELDKREEVLRQKDQHMHEIIDLIKSMDQKMEALCQAQGVAG